MPCELSLTARGETSPPPAVLALNPVELRKFSIGVLDSCRAEPSIERVELALPSRTNPFREHRPGKRQPISASQIVGVLIDHLVVPSLDLCDQGLPSASHLIDGEPLAPTVLMQDTTGALHRFVVVRGHVVHRHMVTGCAGMSQAVPRIAVGSRPLARRHERATLAIL